MINYVGYAVSHDSHEVWLIESDYADRKSVTDNADRCISEAMGYPCSISSVEVHTAAAGEDIAEEAEAYALDHVTGRDGVETGYALHSVPIVVSRPSESPDMIVRRYAKEARADVAAMLSMFGAWQSLHQERDEARAAQEFVSFVRTMRAVY